MTFCSSCGTEMPADAEFCPKCGKRANEPPFMGIDPHMMRHAMRDEYRAQRHAYKAARHAARWGGWTWSPEWALIDALFGGLVVIILGGSLFMAASGVSPMVTWANFWAYFLLGLGVLLLLRGLAALVVPGRPHEVGSMVGGLVLMVIGAAGVSVFLTGWSQYFWAGIIVLGGILVILVGILNYIFRKGSMPPG